jgi:lycopene elongase/hydratase (dihydrobisanhydrobacterioruberin-forming)
MGQRALILLKISRPPLWMALPLVFCMGLAYGQRGLTDPSFRFTPLMICQLFLLSFPICLFTFGLNDIHDHRSDQMNPRKRGIEGIRLEARYHRMVRITAFWLGILFISVSTATANAANVYFAVTLLCLSYVYSTPPWRLKTRPPFDIISAGILGFLAPFGLGFSFVDHVTALPLQAYYFTCCVMGFHAFSTIMDHDIDQCIGDRTFAVAYGKRAAALFPAAIFLCSPFVVRVNYIRGFFMACLILFIVVAVIPSERVARYSFLAIFVGAVAIVGVWIASFMLR